jgi:hypothetical protein
LLVDANEAFANDRSALSKAIHFLKVLLREGSVSKKKVDERAKDAGLKDITLRRAKAFLGVEAVHEGYGKGSVWKWALPLKALNFAKDIKDTHVNRVSNFAANEYLLVEGCRLADILAHADPIDHEHLKNPEVLAFFARTLKNSGKISLWKPNC